MASEGHSAPERPGLGCFPLPSASEQSGGLHVDSPSLGVLSTSPSVPPPPGRLPSGHPS